MTDQPADLLAAAAQRIRAGDRRIDIALCGPLAAWLDQAEEALTSTEMSDDEPALLFARAVLGQDGGQQ